MVHEILMPDAGQTTSEARIARWLRQPGDRVELGDALLEIETDKATLEVESIRRGFLRKTLFQEGSVVEAGTVIAFISDEAQEPLAESVADRAAMRATPAAAPMSMAIPAPKQRLAVSPAARPLANELGVDLETIRGTGPGGLITRKDIVCASPGSARPLETRVPLSPLRQAIARHTAEAKSKVPHFYLSTEVVMDRAEVQRKQLEQSEGVHVSITALVVRAAAAALVAFPAANAVFRGDHLARRRGIDIGVVVSLDDGFLVPVVRQADAKSPVEITRELARLTERARVGKLTSTSVGDASLTVSNLGMFGITEFAGVLNSPEPLLLAVGALRRAPLWREDGVFAQSVLTLTLSVDHRVLDGVPAARFLAHVKKELENFDS